MVRRDSQGKNAGSRLFSLLVLAVDIVLLGALAGVVIYTLPRFTKIFEEFDAALPTFSQWLIGVPTNWYLGALAGVGLLLALKEIVIRNARVASALNCLAGLLLLGCVGAVIVGLFLPLISLVENLS